MDLTAAYTQAVQEDRDWRETKVSNVLPWLPTLPVEPVDVMTSIDMSPYITYPYDRALMPVIDEALKAQGWEVAYVTTEAECQQDWEAPRTTYRRRCGENSIGLVVEFSDSVPGAVCKRRKIGQSARPVNIYDFVCP